MKLAGARDIAPSRFCRVGLATGQNLHGRCGSYEGHDGPHWNVRIDRLVPTRYEWDDDGQVTVKAPIS